MKSVKVSGILKKKAIAAGRLRIRKYPTIFEEAVKQRIQGATISHKTGKRNLNIFQNSFTDIAKRN